jgi:hypothetical protein
MSCEYENRCVNSDKCYRCFNQQLLRLPEDKQKARHRTNKVHNKKVAAADDSWKDLESTVADKLNRVPTMKEARRSRASGALWFEKGDIVDEILHPECKERKGRELKGGGKSISIQRLWLEKAKEECRASNKIMVLPFRFKEDENIYGIFDFDDIADLVTTTKAYIMDNDMKAKEIELLKEEVNLLRQRLEKYERV